MDVLGLGRGRTAWAVPLLLFLAVLLVAGLAFNLANLDTGGDAVPEIPDAGGTRPTPGSLVDARPLVFTVLVVLAASVVGFGFYLLFHRERRERPQEIGRHRSDFLRTVLMLFIFALVLWAWRQLNPGTLNVAEENPPTNSSDGRFPTAPLTTIGGIPLAWFLALALLASLVAAVYLLRPFIVPPRREPAELKDVPREAAAEAVDETIRDIELGADVRSSILLCFHRFCQLLGARGLREQDALTPRELEGLAISRLRVSADSADDLTALFEEARYSVHPLREEDRVRALESLERIRAALEA